MPKSLHLRGVPGPLADALTPDQKRDLADYRTGQERRRRETDAKGWANTTGGVPDFLATPEAQAPRAADLWRTLKPGASENEAIELGRRFGLDAEGTRAALAALRRAELLTTGPDGLQTHGPGNVPF